MKRSQKLYCADILERIQRIESYTTTGKQAFIRSKIQQDAVIFCFTIIGEAIKQLQNDLISQQPQIDWRGFARLRDVLVHQYHRAEIEVAWLAVEEEIPALKLAVTALLNSLHEDEESFS